MQWKQVAELGLALPEVVEDIWWRTPALKVRGKSFVRLKEDGENVVFMLESIDEQEALCDAMADVYWITDHYRGYPAVMARLATLTEAECRLRLVRAWRLKAPKKLVAALDAEPAKAKPAKAKPAKPKPAKPKPAEAKPAKPKPAKPKPAKPKPAKPKSAKPKPARARRA